MLRTRLASSALALIACSIGSFSVAAAAPSGGAPPTTDGEAGGGNGSPPVDIEFQVDMILGIVPTDEMNEFYANSEREQQEAIQACMNGAGFDYNVDTNSSGFVSAPEQSPEEQLEWARRFGFGIWTTMDPDAATEAFPEYNSVDEWVDPNPFVQELSPSEQSAWYEQSSRCYEQAYESNALDAALLNPMVQQALDDFETWVDSDPRMGDAHQAWRDCMADAGQPFADDQAMYDSVYGADTTGELQNRFWESEAWEPDSPDHAEWQALVDNEIAVAVAAATCTPALSAARQEIAESMRPRLLEAWRQVDWNLPPVSYPDDDMPLGAPLTTEP